MPRGVYDRSKIKKDITPLPKVRPEVKLPDGVTIVERSQELELSFRTHNKWLPIAQKVEQLTGTQTIQIDLGDLTDMPGVGAKNKINSIRAGIQKAWKSLGHKQLLKSGVQGNKMYVWANL